MGSLFQLRDFWSQSFPGEEFSPSAVAVGDLDNLDTIDKVAIGSFQGYLRILLPGNSRNETNPTDSLFEQKFDEPILQLACGKFQPISADVSRNLLAVLFPRKLVLMSVERFGGHGDRNPDDGSFDVGETKGTRQFVDTYYRCEKQFETHFEHTVYNFTYGPFGRANHDLICVQSMDGQLSIVDHNKVICQRFFPSNQFLIPGSIAYCWQRDTFVTNNSSMFLMCYDLSNIANSLGSQRKESRDEETGEALVVAASGGGSGGRIAPAWAFNLGDDAVDIKLCRLTRGLERRDGNIVVLCPYSLFVLSLDGQCMLSKRLDVETCSLCVYPLPGGNADNLLIGAFNGNTYVYSDVALEWCAFMKAGCPMHLSVSSLCGTEGMILSLNSESTLAVNYLGTDPADGSLQPLESKATSYTDMNHELRTVQQTIRRLLESGEEDAALNRENDGATQLPSPAAATVQESKEGTATAEAKGSFPVPGLASAPLGRPEDVRAGASSSSAPAPSATDTFALSLSFAEPELSETSDIILPLVVKFPRPFQHLQTLQDIVIQVDTTDPIVVAPAHKTLPRISVGESLTVPFRISAAPDKDQIVPSSLDLTAVVVFTGTRYNTWATRKSTRVPLTLVARPVPPVKNTAFSFQLNTNTSPPPSLVDLFSDLAQFGNVTPNVLSVHYLNGADATILVSKNAARFKLQGSTMEGLWLLTSELVRRMRDRCQSADDLVFSIPDEVPLVDFSAVIDTHAAIRKELTDAVAKLNNAAQFLRSVEKRLLVRFRDRNPSQSETMTVLFEDSYHRLQEATDGVVRAKSRQRQACAMLNCCARLVFFWMRIKYAETFEKMTSSKRKEIGRGNTDAKASRSTSASTDAVGSITTTATTENLLKELFTCDISADDGVGWEEVTETALVQLLDVKTRRVADKNLEVSLNTTNLKKYFTQLVDHIKAGKGF